MHNCEKSFRGEQARTSGLSGSVFINRGKTYAERWKFLASKVHHSRWAFGTWFFHPQIFKSHSAEVDNIGFPVHGKCNQLDEIANK